MPTIMSDFLMILGGVFIVVAFSQIRGARTLTIEQNLLLAACFYLAAIYFKGDHSAKT